MATLGRESLDIPHVSRDVLVAPPLLHRGRKSLEMPGFGRPSLDMPNFGLESLDMPNCCRESLDLSLGPRPWELTIFRTISPIKKLFQCVTILNQFFLKILTRLL